MTKKSEKSKTKRSKYLSQSAVPKWPLSKAIEVPKAIYDNYAGDATTPLEVAAAMDISPTSSNWQEIPGSSVAYGLTTGSYNAAQIALTDLGEKIVAPKRENDVSEGLVEAVLKPSILNKFYTKYDNKKFPRTEIAKNVLVSMGVPKNRVDTVLDIVIENGKFAGIFREIKNNLYVILAGSSANVPEGNDKQEDSHSENPGDEQDQNNDHIPEELSKKLGLKEGGSDQSKKSESVVDKRVFISHGKNKKILKQLKELLAYGDFEVVVSIEKESLAIPVPDKVFSDMRTCSAAVIHIESEQEITDGDGNINQMFNENVLIEIGAAIALYDKRFILLCEKSIELPSNLQGLYRCNYEGEKLDYDATMKLLKAFNEFK